jgi:hypothetical protein
MSPTPTGGPRSELEKREEVTLKEENVCSA